MKLIKMTEAKENLILPDVLKQLEELSRNQKLIEHALKSCKENLDSCFKEDEEMGFKPLKGWKLEEIKMVFEKQSLVFKHGLLSYPYIDTQIGLYVDDHTKIFWNDLCPIGNYSLITHLEGKVVDDYLVIDERPEDR